MNNMEQDSSSVPAAADSHISAPLHTEQPHTPVRQEKVSEAEISPHSDSPSSDPSLPSTGYEASEE